MLLQQMDIDCQKPINGSYITRKYSIIQCELQKKSEEYETLQKKAENLAGKVNRAAANASDEIRGANRLILDAFGGVLAEAGWIQFINSNFGVIANSAPFTSAAQQIDITLIKGELAEVRSSFPRNGVKFAICSSLYNFKNIGPYSNTVKPGEVQKHLYLGVLFDTQKHQLLEDNRVSFCLIGGSTWRMMLQIGINRDLVPDGGLVQTRSNYKVIPYSSALDAFGVINAIEELGYKRIRNN